jgi:hypothetical protein
VNDDVVLMSLQYSTQWDSLAHIGSRFDADGDGIDEMVFYNGYRAGVDLLPAREDPQAVAPYARYPNPQANALGIEHLATHGVQGRGVLIDLDKHLGRSRQAVGYDRLMRIIDHDKISIDTGDMLCLHTGYADTLLRMNRQPDVHFLHATGSGLDGDDPKLLNWLVDCRIACLIADNLAVELMPSHLPISQTVSPNHTLKHGSEAASAESEEGRPLRRPKLPLHEHCLFKNGIPLGELWYLTELAAYLQAHNRHHFLLTAPPLRLPGAVGSPTTPIATV